MPSVADQVRDVATNLGVDPDFATQIAMQESRMDPAAVSEKGARGVMQVMPATAKEMAKKYGPDPIAHGVGYLKDLGGMFEDVPEEQRRHFIAAAYNAGPHRVVQAMEQAKGKGLDPYNIGSLADFLPSETLAYVADLGEGRQAPAQQAFDTPLSSQEETKFQAWKRQYAPQDSGADYDLRGAFQAGLTPNPQTGHWPDTFKKPNHPTFSVESQYAKYAPDKAGHWEGNTYVPASSTTSTTTAPTSPRRLGLVPALTGSLASGEQRVEDTLRELTRPAETPEESTITGALKRSGRALVGLAGSAIPTGNVGQVIGGTQARMRGQSPEDVATAEERGGNIGALLGAIPGGAKALLQLSPKAHAATATARALAGRGAENLETGISQVAQLGERGIAGTATQQVAEAIPRRLVATAGTEASQAASAERAFGDRATQQAEKALSTAVAKPMTVTDYSKTFQALRRDHEVAAKVAIDFDRQVTQKIANLGPHNLSTRLAKDPDLLNGLLQHATPEEATIIQRAVTAGQPLSKLPWTADQLSSIGENALAGKGLFGSWKNYPVMVALGGAAGERFAGPIIGSHPYAAATIAAGTLAFKTFDAMAGSRKGMALLQWIGKADQGSLAAQAGLRALGELAGGPRKLQPPQPLVARQLGGPVAAGQPALVGERGPEIVVPKQDVEMVPALGGGMIPKGSVPPPPPKPIAPSGGGHPAQEGLSDEDAKRARQRGFVVIMGPGNTPVVVRQ